MLTWNLSKRGTKRTELVGDGGSIPPWRGLFATFCKATWSRRFTEEASRGSISLEGGEVTWGEEEDVPSEGEDRETAEGCHTKSELS